MHRATLRKPAPLPLLPVAAEPQWCVFGPSAQSQVIDASRELSANRNLLNRNFARFFERALFGISVHALLIAAFVSKDDLAGEQDLAADECYRGTRAFAGRCGDRALLDI